MRWRPRLLSQLVLKLLLEHIFIVSALICQDSTASKSLKQIDSWLGQGRERAYQQAQVTQSKHLYQSTQQTSSTSNAAPQPRALRSTAYQESKSSFESSHKLKGATAANQEHDKVYKP